MELPPRAFDTLLVLVENNGRLLEKDALMRTVWYDTVVEENNLTQVVYLVRKALRDGEDGARYIETVPKRGYRFVGEVREFEADSPGNGNGHNGGNGRESQSSSPSGNQTCSFERLLQASDSAAAAAAGSESEVDSLPVSAAGASGFGAPLQTRPRALVG